MLDPFISSRTMVRLGAGLQSNLGTRAVLSAISDADLALGCIKSHRMYISQVSQLNFFDTLARNAGLDNLVFGAADHASIADYGLFGRYVTSAKTLGDALKITAEMMPFHASHDRLSLRQEPPFLILTYHCSLRNAVGYPHYAAFAMVVASSIAASFTDRPLLRRVEFNFPKPSLTEQYETLFGCEVAFDRPELSMYFDEVAASLPRKVSTAEIPTLADVAREAFGPAPTTLIDAVKSLLRSDLQNKPNSESVAFRLNMSERTLRRRLQEKGETFRSIAKDVRLEHAQELLLFTDRAVAEIAQQTGYSDASHLGRALKSRVDAAPRAHRLRTRLHNLAGNG